MSFLSVQVFLEQAFEFLRDRQLNINREEWKKFYTSKEISLEQLNVAKSELLTQLCKSEKSEETKLLQKIFCCDPFDREVIKNLRDIWSDQGEPFKSWSYDLVDHLMTISVQPDLQVPEFSNTKVNYPLENKAVDRDPKPKIELFKVIIASSIVGIFILLGLTINNYINRQSNLAINSPSAKPTLANTSSPQNFVQPSEEEKLPTRQVMKNDTIDADQAMGVVKDLYDAVSSQQFDRAYSLISPEMQLQFKPSFFEQFTQVTVENLRVTNQTNNSINLTGYNTYFYPDGSTQREKRSYLISSLNGQPKIVSSRFIKVTKLRN